VFADISHCFVILSCLLLLLLLLLLLVVVVVIVELLVIEQIFEWWYFKKYGTSFIEQFTITYLSPLLGGAEPSTPDSEELVPATPELTVPGMHSMCLGRNCAVCICMYKSVCYPVVIEPMM